MLTKYISPYTKVQQLWKREVTFAFSFTFFQKKLNACQKLACFRNNKLKFIPRHMQIPKFSTFQFYLYFWVIAGSTDNSWTSGKLRMEHIHRKDSCETCWTGQVFSFKRHTFSQSESSTDGLTEGGTKTSIPNCGQQRPPVDMQPKQQFIWGF